MCLDFEGAIKDGIVEKAPKAQLSYKVIGDGEESGFMRGLQLGIIIQAHTYILILCNLFPMKGLWFKLDVSLSIPLALVTH